MMNYIEYVEGGEKINPYNKTRDGKLPKGQKKMGFKELSWTKEQLNQYDRK